MQTCRPKQGNLYQAVVELEATLAGSPANCEAALLLAVTKFRMGDHGRALQLNQQAGKQWSENPTSVCFAQWYYECASDLIRRGQLPLAEHAYANVIAISGDIDYGYARNDLGNLYKQQNKFAAAKAAYIDALRIRCVHQLRWSATATATATATENY